METRKEFYVSPDGETHVLIAREDRLLRHSPKLVEELSILFERHFAEAMRYCWELTRSLGRGEKLEEFLAVDRFIRCNFSNRDLMPDVAHGIMELEDVPCHLRGICPYENKICRPRCTSLKRSEERSVAEYCIRYDIGEAARHSYECDSSLRHKLVAVRKRLGFRSNAELVRFFKGIHLERRLAIY